MRTARWRRRLPELSRARKIIYCSAALFVLALLALALTLASGPGKAARQPPPPRAHSFALAQLGHPAATVSLAQYTGRPLIVNFFASWCAPCQRETPLLARFYTSQHGRVLVVGVDSNDQTAAALRFLAKAGVRYPVGLDPFPSTTTTTYGVYALPQTFFLNAQHRIVLHVLGPLTMKDLSHGVALMDSHGTTPASQNRG